MAQWKGLRVEVPGRIFYEPDKTWLGTVTGVVQGSSSTKRKSVYVEFDDDEEKYWFKMVDVVDWLVDKEKAELLRPTIHGTPKRKSKTKSPSMEPSFSARSDIDEPAPARSPIREDHSRGDATHSQGKQQIEPPVETANKSNGEAGPSQDMLPLPPPLPPIDEALRTAESPSGSMVGKFSSWMSKKLKPSNGEEGVEGMEGKRGEGLEDMDVPDKGFETEEEVLDDSDLDRISGGTPMMPVSEKSGGRGWLGRVKEVFYTPLPFTPISFRRARLSQLEERSVREEEEEEEGEEEDVVGSGLRSVERSVLFPVHGFRMINNPPSEDDTEPTPKEEVVTSSGYGTRIYCAFKTMFSQRPIDDACPAGVSSPTVFHRRHKFVPSDLEIVGSSAENEYSDGLTGEGGASEAEDPGESPPAKWQPFHVFSSIAIAAAWGSIMYLRYCQTEEEGEQE